MTLQRRGLQLIALELAAGLVLAAGYLGFVRPHAPRPVARVAAVPEPKVETPMAVVIVPPEPAPLPAPLPAGVPALKPSPVPVPVRKAPPAAVKAKPLPVVVPAPVLKHAPVPEPAPIKAELAPVATPAKPAPATPEALVQQGIASLNARQWPLALEAFEAARRLQPGNPDLGYLRGMALENLGQPGAAIDAYQSCTAGPYMAIAKAHVKTLVSRLRQAR